MHVAANTKLWTLEELHSLPDDGNKYELVRGELFVTPRADGDARDDSRASLAHPRSVRRGAMDWVRLSPAGRYALRRFRGRTGSHGAPARSRCRRTDWATAPMPILIVEIRRRRARVVAIRSKSATSTGTPGSPSTGSSIRSARETVVVKPGAANEVARDRVTWSPPGTTVTTRRRRVAGFRGGKDGLVQYPRCRSGSTVSSIVKGSRCFLAAM